MKKIPKIILSIVTILLSVIAGALGCGFAGGGDFSFAIKVLLMSVFILQALFTVSLVMELFRKNRP